LPKRPTRSFTVYDFYLSSKKKIFQGFLKISLKDLAKILNKMTVFFQKISDCKEKILARILQDFQISWQGL